MNKLELIRASREMLARGIIDRGRFTDDVIGIVDDRKSEDDGFEPRMTRTRNDTSVAPKKRNNMHKSWETRRAKYGTSGFSTDGKKALVEKLTGPKKRKKRRSKMSWQEWSSADDDYLRKHNDGTNHTIKKLAKDLGRSYASTYTRAFYTLKLPRR